MPSIDTTGGAAADTRTKQERLQDRLAADLDRLQADVTAILYDKLPRLRGCPSQAAAMALAQKLMEITDDVCALAPDFDDIPLAQSLDR